MNEYNLAGAKSLITQKKIDNLYNIVQKYKTLTLISKVLGVDCRTFQSWLKKGEDTLNLHPKFYSELTDSYLDMLETSSEEVEKNIESLRESYLSQTKEESINKYNQSRFEEFVRKFEVLIFEENIKKIEDSMIDDYIFNENDSKNESLKKYIKIKRVYDRATLARTLMYVGNIDKHAGTTKNVGLSKWLLETTEESFAPQKVEHEVKHYGEVSLLDMSVSEERKDNNKNGN